MRFSSRSFVSILCSLVFAIALFGGTYLAGAVPGQAKAASTNAGHVHIDCAVTSYICTDVGDSDEIFGHYVGHDEPSTLFYSTQPGSGNHVRYQLTLPRDPSAANPLTPGKSYNFQLHPTFWFGMVLCATQSYPEQVSSCTPDSDKNIVDPTVSSKHPGAAFAELQFYPPGWVPHPFSFDSCDATQWCAALNVDSLSVDPIAGTINNSACIATAGIEPVNFAFVTHSGVAQAPVSPLLQTNASFTPDPAKDLFMKSGDTLSVSMHDSQQGLRIEINDLTTGQSGSMTASAANGFAQVRFDPNGADCNPATHNLPYDFHPMYSTSSEKTDTVWAVHSYNIAFSDEIGHFEFCNGSNPITQIGSPNGGCPTGNTEGVGSDTEPTDADEAFCYPASLSTLVKIAGCIDAQNGNFGFDGPSYMPVWPDGNTRLHPTPVQFSSPLTGSGYNINYNRVAFEADTPAIEPVTQCNVDTGAGCTLLPQTDDGVAVAFYPFYSIRSTSRGCVWQIGNHIPGDKNDFGQDGEYGTLLNSNSYLFGGGGQPRTRYFDFRQILSSNPCRA